MKKSIFAIVFILLCNLSWAQVQRSASGYTQKTIISQEKKGKLSISLAANRDTSAKIIINNPYGISDNDIQLKPKVGIAKQINVFHVVFHFDKWCALMLCNSSDTAFMDQWNMNWVNDLTLEAWMPEGHYDLLNMFFENGFDSPVYVFVNDFYVNKVKDTTILSTSPNHQVNLRSYDENNILITGNNLEGDGLGVIIEFPANFKSSFATMAIAGCNTDHVKFSTVSPDIKIYLGRTHVVKHELYQRYEISYPVLMGVQNNIQLDNNPSDYRLYSLVYNSTPSIEEPFFVFGYGFMVNSLLAPFNYLTISWGCDNYPSKIIDTIKVFTTDVVVDTNHDCPLKID